MKSWHLTRRTFLRGTGVCIALPWLEGMSHAAPAEKIKPRVCFTYFHYGVPMPPDDHPDRLKYGWFPVGEGKDYQATETLASLEPFRDKLTYLGGLSHPLGRRVGGHQAGDVFLTGADISGSLYRQSISVDQVASMAIGDDNRFPSMVLSTSGGVNRPYKSHTLSYDEVGRPIPSLHKPQDIFERLFGASSGQSKAQQRQAFRQKGSILDTVREEAASLNRRLGKRDQQKMDEYLSSVREVEKGLVRSKKWLDVAKPEVGVSAADFEISPESTKEYIRSKYDLMALAFQTNSTRVATYQTSSESEQGYEKQFPKAVGLNVTSHNISHERTDYQQWSTYSRFLVEQHAWFLDRLNSIEEGAGTLLDNTMVLYGCCTSETHVTRNYPLILAGGASLGIKHGQYRKFSEDVPLSNLFVTMLQKMDVRIDSFKDSTGPLNEVLV